MASAAGAHFDYSSWNEGIMSLVAFDFDNDGWLDLYRGDSDYPGSHGRLYRQVAPMRFVDGAPPEVYAMLLDEGRRLCSGRSMYR